MRSAQIEKMFTIFSSWGLEAKGGGCYASSEGPSHEESKVPATALGNQTGAEIIYGFVPESFFS